MSLIADLGSAFVLGLLTPLTAVCVLPLYPGFLSYITRQFGEEDSRRLYALTGVIVALGTLSFMLLTGLIFTTFLQQSLTAVIGIISPIAFGLLTVIGILLILDIDMGERIPQIAAPETDHPLLNAYLFGFFFGAIVLPCNPAFIAVFFSRSLLFQDPFINLLRFAAFGIGIGAPLFAFSIITAQWSRTVIGFLTAHRTAINRIAGTVMVAVSLYYLLYVFNILGL